MARIFYLILFFSTYLLASIGTITSIEGSAKILREGSQLTASIGIKIEKQDILSTEKDSSLKIILVDNTIVTIGKESTLNIEEYVFDEANKEESQTELNFVKGAFHTITGQIGKINPSKFKLKTKSASIGIRGTEIYADENRVICTSGVIEVLSFGKSNLVPSGSYIETYVDKIPSEVKPIDKRVLEELKNNLRNEVNIEIDINNAKKELTSIQNTVEKKKIILDKTKLSVKEGDSTVSGTLKAVTTSTSKDFTYSTNSNVNGFSLNSDGTYSFNPSNASYDNLKRGETKTLNIPITVKDKDGLTTNSIIEIKVIGNSDLKGKHLGATSSTLEVDNLNSSMNVYDDKIVLNAYSPVKSVEFSYNKFKNSYSTHSDLGTVSFTQSINSSLYNGTYNLHGDDKGEFIVGYSSDGTYKSLFYDGLVSSKSVLNDSKIYTYKVYKGLNVNYSDNNTTIDSVAFNNSTTKLIKLNTKTGSIASLDTSNKIEDSGFKFEVAKLNSDGTISAKAYKVNENVGGTGVTKDSYSDVSGQLYGSEGQGIGIYADVKSYTSSVSTMGIYSSYVTEKTSKVIDTYYLDKDLTKTNSSTTGIKTFEGLTSAIYTKDYTDKTSAGNKIIFKIDNETGDFTSGKISFVDKNVTPNTYTDKFEMISKVDTLGAYYINSDLFGTKITSSSDGTLIDDTSWIVSISDKVNTDGTFSENFDNESSWGYWTANVKNSSGKVENINAYSTWVAGTKTEVSTVQQLINGSANTVLNFKGNIIGAVVNGTNIDAIKLDTNNIVNLKFTLGSSSGSFNGDYSFYTQGNTTDKWTGNFSGNATSSGFSGTTFNTLKVGSSSAINNGSSIDGNYYGTNEIKSVGGSINVKTTTNGNVVGSFKADKVQ